MSKKAPPPASEIEQVRQVLETLIVWITQSAASPLSYDDARRLLEMLQNGKP
jgi:hypothetical protein